MNGKYVLIIVYSIIGYLGLCNVHSESYSFQPSVPSIAWCGEKLPMQLSNEKRGRGPPVLSGMALNEPLHMVPPSKVLSPGVSGSNVRPAKLLWMPVVVESSD